MHGCGVMKWTCVAMISCLSVLSCLAPHVAKAEQFHGVVSCALHSEASVTLYRSRRIADTHVYSLGLGGKFRKPIFGNEEESRGMSVKFQCVGDEDRVLILSGEFSSNYIQGLVVRYDEKRKTLDRLEFSERERPDLVYVGKDHVSVVIPSPAVEGGARYIVYSLSSKNGRKVTREVTDSLPDVGGKYELQR